MDQVTIDTAAFVAIIIGVFGVSIFAGAMLGYYTALTDQQKRQRDLNAKINTLK